jgi:UDP-sugar transporter A1/2/3
MLLLAVQVALQPRISRWLVRPEDSKVSVALMEEVAKTVLALALWWLHHQQGPPGDRGGPAAASGSAGWSLPASLASAGAPAALYAVQGVLTYVGLQNLDAITFNGLSQLKTVSAAIFCYLILGTSQTRPQIAAIALLLASSLLFQLPKKKPELGSRSLAANPAGEEAVVISREILRDQSTSDPLECRARASTPAASAGTTAAAAAASFRGVSACLTATAISGLAGALSQSGVQQRGTAAQLVGGGRDPYLYCAEVSLYSALCLLFSSLLKRLLAPTPLNLTPTKISSRDASVARNTTAWATKFRWSLWIPVTVKAMGGIVTVLVHKHAGSVPKGFALVLGLVLSGMLERDPLTPPQLLGTIFVLTSSWMHFTNGPR